MLANSYVYFLIDPRNNMPFYVGKGKGDRCNFHIKEAKYYVDRKSLKLNKIRKIVSLGLEPIVRRVEENITDSQAIEFEMFLISELRASGIKLTNMTDGGDGAQGYSHTDEHKKHMSALFKNRVFSEETKERMRKPKLETGRKNIAAARVSSTYRPSEETKRKTSESLRGRESPMKGRTHSQKARSAMSLQRKGIQKPRSICPHCNKTTAVHLLKRWHLDNCKEKELYNAC